jgi:four helix bundle protein
MTQYTNKYDLEERTAKFGEAIIDLCKTIHPDIIMKPIISQIIRSSTSIGANYMEANSASSRKDFTHKIYLCKKESQETKHWLRMLTRCLPDRSYEFKKSWQEAQELTFIFQKITYSLKNNYCKL